MLKLALAFAVLFPASASAAMVRKLTGASLNCAGTLYETYSAFPAGPLGPSAGLSVICLSEPKAARWVLISSVSCVPKGTDSRFCDRAEGEPIHRFTVSPDDAETRTYSLVRYVIGMNCKLTNFDVVAVDPASMSEDTRSRAQESGWTCSKIDTVDGTKTTTDQLKVRTRTPDHFKYGTFTTNGPPLEMPDFGADDTGSQISNILNISGAASGYELREPGPSKQWPPMEGSVQEGTPP